MKRKLTLLRWWLVECWRSFPFRPLRKSPQGDGKFASYISPDLFEMFKDVGKQQHLQTGTRIHRAIENCLKENEKC